MYLETTVFVACGSTNLGGAISQVFLMQKGLWVVVAVVTGPRWWNSYRILSQEGTSSLVPLVFFRVRFSC